jgi:GATA-binding protein
MSPRSNKRRRMSTDSAMEPPSSAASYSSYNGSSISSSSSGDGYTSAASTPSHHSKKNSMDFSFSPFSPNGSINQGLALRGSGNTFWHPPMMPQNQADAEVFWHPPLVPPTTSSVSFNTSIKDTLCARDSASVSSSSRKSVSNSPQSHTNNSAMDFLHNGMIQDGDLFSAYLHAHDEKTSSNAENGSSTVMYIDSYF